MKPSKKKSLMPPHPTVHDPFSNMIARPNKNPLLKPVVVNSRETLMVSRSAGSLRERFKLPPLKTPRQSRLINVLQAERNTLQTPNFRITSKINAQKEIEFRNSKRTKNEFELSFGDVDEQVSGINEIMRKYRS